MFVYDVSNTTYSINSDNECLCPNKHQCTDGASTMAPCLYGKFYVKKLFFWVSLDYIKNNKEKEMKMMKFQMLYSIIKQ